MNNIKKSVLGQQFLEQRLPGLELILRVVDELHLLGTLDMHHDHRIKLGGIALLQAFLRMNFRPRVRNAPFFAYYPLSCLPLLLPPPLYCFLRHPSQLTIKILLVLIIKLSLLRKLIHFTPPQFIGLILLHDFFQLHNNYASLTLWIGLCSDERLAKEKASCVEAREGVQEGGLCILRAGSVNQKIKSKQKIGQRLVGIVKDQQNRDLLRLDRPITSSGQLVRIWRAVVRVIFDCQS